jgi:hypothetical protein
MSTDLLGHWPRTLRGKEIGFIGGAWPAILIYLVAGPLLPGVDWEKLWYNEFGRYGLDAEQAEGLAGILQNKIDAADLPADDDGFPAADDICAFVHFLNGSHGLISGLPASAPIAAAGESEGLGVR